MTRDTLTKAPRHSGEDKHAALALINCGRGVAGVEPLDTTDGLELFTRQNQVGKVVGALAVLELKKPDEHGVHYRIVGMYVDEGSRGQGIGGKLLSSAHTELTGSGEGAAFLKIGLPPIILDGSFVAFALSRGVVCTENNLPPSPFDPEI